MTNDHDYDRFHFRWSGHSYGHESLSVISNEVAVLCEEK